MSNISKTTTTSVNQDNGNEYQFKKSIFFPWTKVRMSLDHKKRLLVADKKTLFWTIPIGRTKERSFFLRQISRADVEGRFRLNIFVTGIVLLYAYIYLVSYAFVLDVVVGFVSIFVFSLLLVAGLYCISKGKSYKIYLTHKETNKKISIDVSLREKDKIQELAVKVNKAIKNFKEDSL